MVKLTKPKVVRNSDKPMSTGDKAKTVAGMIVAGILYLAIALSMVFMVGFAVCMAILS